jgi:hypothetical protein
MVLKICGRILVSNRRSGVSARQSSLLRFCRVDSWVLWCRGHEGEPFHLIGLRRVLINLVISKELFGRCSTLFGGEYRRDQRSTSPFGFWVVFGALRNRWHSLNNCVLYASIRLIMSLVAEDFLTVEPCNNSTPTTTWF